MEQMSLSRTPVGSAEPSRRDVAEVEQVIPSLGRSVWQTQFVLADSVRRAQGVVLEALGLGSAECPYEIIGGGPFWRLRDYGRRLASKTLLVVAAPIKRPYIWDLAPHVSAVRRCLEHGYRVCLVEWISTESCTRNIGLRDCARAVAECAARLSAESRRSKPSIIGHSLGGTLAAISAAFEPGLARSLILLGAPLCFAGAKRFRDGLLAVAAPLDLQAANAVPGSLLSQASAIASPRTFIWWRLMDGLLSSGDARAMEILCRVERWTLDEVPVPSRLIHEIITLLYREDRLCRGTLELNGRRIGPSNLAVPALAVVNAADEIAPEGSVRPFLHAMAQRDTRILTYAGESGVGLQHLGILVGRQAHARIWPQIIAWLDSHS